jgi:hypothetical protein
MWKSTYLIPLAVAAMAAGTGIVHAGEVLITPTAADGGITVNMTQNGGNVMAGATQAFGIFYGNFAPSDSGQPITSQKVVENWLNAMLGTSYMNIALTFTGAPNGTVSNDLTYGGSYDVGAYLGTSLTDAQILQIVQDAKSGSHLPTNSNGIYFVFTAPGISQQEDASACAWHNGDAGTHTVYSWVGPALGCDYLGGVSGSPVGDEFTESGSHELFESLTDPYPTSAWNDNTPGHGEVGDVCVNSNFKNNLNGDQVDVQSIWTLVPPGSPTGGRCSQGVVFSQSAPEPSGGGLFLAGCALLYGSRRRRQTLKTRVLK